MTSTSLVGYLAAFAVTAFATIFVALVIGWFLRPRHPSRAKRETYECGEETIGTSRTRFDSRFYVVALVFLIFDVELAFFFPWGVVYGRAAQLASPAVTAVESDGTAAGNDKVAVIGGMAELTPKTRNSLGELGIADPTLPIPASVEMTAQDVADVNAVAVSEAGSKIMRIALADMAVFFLVLMVGFAYVWRRGDLDWVRAYGDEKTGDDGIGNAEKTGRECEN